MNGNQPGQNVGSSCSTQSSGHSAAPSSASGPGQAASHSAEHLKDKASQTAAQAVSQAKAAATQVKHDVSHQVHDVSHQVYEATEKVKNVGRKYATRKKSQAVAELDVFREAILRAADKLKEENHETVGSYVAAAAEQIGRLRSTLEHRDVQSLLNDAQSLTRRHPEVVYGGLFVAGVALMRFLKASHRDDASTLAARRQTMYSSAQGRSAAGPRTTTRGLQSNYPQGSYRQGGSAQGVSGQHGTETGRVQHSTAQPRGVEQPAQAGRSGSMGSGQAGSSISSTGSLASGASALGASFGSAPSQSDATVESQTNVRPLTASSTYQTGQSLDKPANQESDARIIPSIPPTGTPSSRSSSSPQTPRK